MILTQLQASRHVTRYARRARLGSIAIAAWLLMGAAVVWAVSR